MNILILNWRDIKNPEGGGAEILTHEMAKRWVVQGHRVVQLSSFFRGAARHEFIDGVEVIRKGSVTLRHFGIPVHLAAFLWYLRQGRGRFDVVIDEVHGIPFFTPFYVKEKIVVLQCEVAKEVWDAIFSFPWNKIGRIIERIYFSFYKEVPFLAISPSTKRDIVNMGIDSSHVTVLPMGLSVPKKINKFPKEEKPTLVFVGRPVKSKGIEDAFSVFQKILLDFPDAKLWIIGQGHKRILHNITYFGFVSEEKKFELMARAHILLNPSIREGWGLTVPEAGWAGTPSVVYNVPGLSDIVASGVNGLIVDKNPEAMATGVLKLLKDKKLYKKIQIEVRASAKQYNWDRTAKAALDVLSKQA